MRAVFASVCLIALAWAQSSYLPGIDMMGVGYDIVKGGATSAPVVGFSYAAGDTYTNPFTLKTYLIPDCAYVTNDDSSQEMAATQVYTSAEDYASAQATNMNVGFAHGMFSGSAGYSKVQSVLYSGSSFGAYLSSTLAVSIYKVVLPETLNVSSQFEQDLSKLPGEYDAKLFHDFVSHYGTHYISVATYGGYAYASTSVQSSYSSTVSCAELQEQATLNFDFVRFGGSANGTQQQADSAYLAATVETNGLFGGDILLYSSLTQWETWLPTVADSPTQVSLQLENITSLVTNDTIRYWLELTINNYIGGAADSCMAEQATIQHLNNVTSLYSAACGIPETCGPLTTVTTSPANTVVSAGNYFTLEFTSPGSSASVEFNIGASCTLAGAGNFGSHQGYVISSNKQTLFEPTIYGANMAATWTIPPQFNTGAQLTFEIYNNNNDESITIYSSTIVCIATPVTGSTTTTMGMASAFDLIAGHAGGNGHVGTTTMKIVNN